MSSLSAITYSRDATIAAVRDYYNFLTTMYLDEADVITPPPSGWPSIDNLQCMGKTPQVLDLLRHLPYIRQPEDFGPQAFPGCTFADWQQIAQTAEPDDGLTLRECCEPVELIDRIPVHVVALAYSDENSDFLLDTRRGIVHWYECSDAIRYNREENPDPDWVRPVTDVDDPADWPGVSEEEAEWRAEHPAWSVPDFFAILKRQFRDLKYVPISSRAVYHTRANEGTEDPGDVLPAVQEIYRRHGWPDLAAFDKEACKREIRRVVREEYPDHAYLFDEDEEEEDQEEEEEEEDNEE